MPVVVFLLLIVAAAVLLYAVVVNLAYNAIARGTAPETSALRFLPGPVRRFTRGRLLALPSQRISSRAAPVRRRPSRAPERSRWDVHAGKLALRRAARADTPTWLRAWSGVRLALILLMLALAVTASIWLVAAYVTSIISRAIRG